MRSLLEKYIPHRGLRILARIGIWLAVIWLLLRIFFFVGSRINIKQTLYEKSRLEIPYFFSVVENEISHSPSAFDSDYHWSVEIELREKAFTEVLDQIEKPPQANPYRPPKGHWISTKTGYRFDQVGLNPEPTTIYVNLGKRSIIMDLKHL